MTRSIDCDETKFENHGAIRIIMRKKNEKNLKFALNYN